MARNLLYISPQFPPNYTQFVTALRKAGVQVLGVAGDWPEQLPQTLREAMTEYYRVDNMNDYSQMLRAGQYFKKKYGSIDRVESHTEYWLPVEGALREDLGVWGKNRAETALIHRKSAMKASPMAGSTSIARTITAPPPTFIWTGRRMNCHCCHLLT